MHSYSKRRVWLDRLNLRAFESLAFFSSQYMINTKFSGSRAAIFKHSHAAIWPKTKAKRTYMYVSSDQVS
jgi:hypothetical protein